MKRPPYPARVAAGVLVTTAEEAKKLPTRIITLPMSAVSMGLQAGMRLQQNIAEMAIKGDEFFGSMYDDAEEQPAWARFDEDDDLPSVTELRGATRAPKAANKPEPVAEKPAQIDAPSPGAGRFALYSSPPADLAAKSVTPASPSPDATAAEGDPDVVASLGYDQLTLAQLRAQLRGLATADLQTLADYERAHRNRTPFVTMIDNRIASQQKKSEATQ
ncbi:MAG: lipid droplet-associated protein [Gordonia sp. (in: high G+C Gram-positive bacteria)]